MTTVVFFLLFWLCLWAVVHHVRSHYKGWSQKREEALAACARNGHELERIFAFNDPRFPVDKCKRCHFQTPVRYPCPHCGKDLDGSRS